MRSIEPGADADVERTIDREVELLTSALNLVAGGGARSATVAGLHLAEAAVDIVQPLADDLGLVLDLLWSADEDGTDVSVRHATSH